MGLMNSALQIGRTALLSYQSALQVVGANISSAGSPDHTRLLPELDPIPGTPLAEGLQPGAGVTLNGIQRTIDEALEGRIRLAIGEQESIARQKAALVQVESFFDDVGGGTASRITDFFARFNDLQNTPEDTAVRDLVVQGGIQLADSLRGLRRQLASLAEDLDSQVASSVETADGLAGEIADLNERITTAEAGGRGQATALRDQRDARLRELSRFFDVITREQRDGSLNVYVGSEVLVQGSRSRGLAVQRRTDGEKTRSSVHFADTGSQVLTEGGELQGLTRSRDEHVYGRIAAIDELAAGLIAEVNRLHADGQGLIGLTSVTGSFDVFDADVPLNSAAAGLANPPRSGSFFVAVRDDATNTPTAYRIDVDLDGVGDDTTLESLVGELNDTVPGLTASIRSDRRLVLTAEEGFTFTLGADGELPREDTSRMLAALGIGTFFTGRDARDIGVDERLIEQPKLIAAASGFLPGDGSNAQRIAALAAQGTQGLDGESFTDYFTAQLASVATTSGAANSDLEGAAAVLSALRAQRESISGVNLDEEAILLIKFQRAFQGAARYVGVVERLVDELVTLIR